MHTDFFQRTVIRHFQDMDLEYKETGDNEVSVNFATPNAIIRLRISQPREGMQLLVVGAPDFARFPPQRAATAAMLCHTLCDSIIGHLHFDSNNDVSYFLEGVGTDNWGPDEFKELMTYAVSSVNRIYDLVMTVRWANVSLEEATRMLEDGEDGGSRPSDNPNEQLNNILRDRPEADGTEEDDAPKV